MLEDDRKKVKSDSIKGQLKCLFSRKATVGVRVRTDLKNGISLRNYFQTTDFYHMTILIFSRETRTGIGGLGLRIVEVLVTERNRE